MVIDLTTAARVVPLTALTSGACVSRSTYEKQTAVLQQARALAILPLGEQLWERELESYIDFPPLQAPEAYNLTQVLAAVRAMKHVHPAGELRDAWVQGASLPGSGALSKYSSK